MIDTDQAHIRALASHYRTGKDDLRRDFFERCFKHCSHYRRAVGYFSTTALLSWLTGLDRLVLEGGGLEIELIISNELSKVDADALKSSHDAAERKRLLTLAVDKIVDMIIALRSNNADTSERVALFAWLVANGHVTLKFAFPTHLEEVGIFHEKIGVFDFPWGDRVAFTGSANETGSGHVKNYESIDVYRSWIPGDENRVETKQLQFEEAWEDKAEGLEVVPLSEAALNRIKVVARPPCNVSDAAKKPASLPKNKWVHQDEAVSRFLSARRGILEMATGTGKTKTALRIVSELIAKRGIEGAIIATDGTDLLFQWCAELGVWMKTLSRPLAMYRHFGEHHDLGRFIQMPEGSVLVIARGQLPILMRRLPVEARKRLAIVHDEVHGLGMPGLRDGLKGQHAPFPYVLGLSATPERTYDAEGTAFIDSEVGKPIFRFPIEAAIAKGILCEFDYVPLPYELTEDDRKRLALVYTKQAARKHGGNPMSEEEIWIEISKVYKTAEMKPFVFADYLKQNSSSLKRSIIFVETKEYGERVLEVIHDYTNLYRTYYAEDDAGNLLYFSKGELDCLITCHRISQGIDIKSLRTVFLFSSARSKLETVQRIGRCLRIDPEEPDKRALVVDFVRPQEAGAEKDNADTERCQWLQTIAKARKGDEVAYQ